MSYRPRLSTLGPFLRLFFVGRVSRFYFDDKHPWYMCTINLDASVKLKWMRASLYSCKSLQGVAEENRFPENASILPGGTIGVTWRGAVCVDYFGRDKALADDKKNSVKLSDTLCIEAIIYTEALLLELFSVNYVGPIPLIEAMSVQSVWLQCHLSLLFLRIYVMLLCVVLYGGVLGFPIIMSGKVLLCGASFLGREVRSDRTSENGNSLFQAQITRGVGAVTEKTGAYHRGE